MTHGLITSAFQAIEICDNTRHSPLSSCPSPCFESPTTTEGRSRSRISVERDAGHCITNTVQYSDNTVHDDGCYITGPGNGGDIGNVVVATSNNNTKARSAEMSAKNKRILLQRQYCKHNVTLDARQDESRRPWKVKALTALSQLTDLEQQCFDAQQRVCDLQFKYDALILEKDDVEVERERYRAAWGEALSRVDAVELELRVVKGRLALHEARMDREGEKQDVKEVDDLVDNILKRGEEKKKKHVEAKIREEMQKEREEEVKKEKQLIEEKYQGAVSRLESELAEMEIACMSHRQENDSLKHTMRGLEEHLLHAQSRIVQLQEENEYYACFVEEKNIQGNTDDEEDVFKDAVWELKQELGQREEELAAMQECLNEEKARSNGLHEQVLRQVMELEDLRKDARRTKEVEEDLKALKIVHAETLKDLAQLKLANLAPQAVQNVPHQQRATTGQHNGIASVDDESWLM